MKKINALCAAISKLFVWRQIGPEDVLKIRASYRYIIHEDGVNVQWLKGNRIVTNWIPRQRIRIDTTGSVGADETYAEVRRNSCRLTMGRQMYGRYLEQWNELH